MFKVGDAVRVKAGICSNTHKHVCPSFTTSMDKYRGRMGTVKRIHDWFDVLFDRHNGEQINYWDFREDWLEPWNDAEEWDGNKWVPKKKEEAKPAIILKVTEDGLLSNKYPTKHKSTNAAMRVAEDLANAFPGQEYVVYQEKGSRKVEKQSKAELLAKHLLADGESAFSDFACCEDFEIVADVLSAVPDGDKVTVCYKVKS